MKTENDDIDNQNSILNTTVRHQGCIQGPFVDAVFICMYVYIYI